MRSGLSAFLTNNIFLLFCLGEFQNNITVLTQKQRFFAVLYNVILILVVYFYLLVLYGIKYLNLHLLYLLG